MLVIFAVLLHEVVFDHRKDPYSFIICFIKLLLRVQHVKLSAARALTGLIDGSEGFVAGFSWIELYLIRVILVWIPR